MKIISTKRTLAAMIFSLSSIALCTSYAAAAPGTNNTDADNVIISTKHDRVVQEFKHDQVDVSFLYMKGKLFGLKLLNTGKEALHIEVLHKTYLIGPKDFVVIDLPNVKNLVLHHHPATTFKTTVGKALSQRFGSHHVYNLPDKTQEQENAATKPGTSSGAGLN